MALARSTPFAVLILLLAAPGNEHANAASVKCPVPQEKFREITEAQIEQFCFQPIKALTPVRNPGGRMAAVRQCRNSFLQIRESARVIYATTERQNTFHPDIGGLVDQKTAPEKAARLLLDAHTFTNISMAAIYRSRLKVRKVLGQGKRELEDLLTETNFNNTNRDQTIQAEKDARAQGNPGADRLRDVDIPAFAKDLQAIRESQRTVNAAEDCADKIQSPLDANFDDWAKVKRGLLTENFEKLVTKDLYPDPVKQGQAAFVAQLLQADQQAVYDNLTDSSKKGTAYRLAEACEEKRCDTWITIASGVGWFIRTPVIGAIAKGISGSAAFVRANGQGLDFWQGMRETGNAISPFQIKFLDTEVGAIEKGEVRPFITGS